ncbi:Uncharacterized protein TCM_042458 [Theobroma cacao]|uniref:Uncharacterized protein n=1 Tax=Theobroma cacao TaxID=3641 RepID=A0A061FLE9_THECC|nr:Uncharacterized protein TCM_042458 [Theobroma cacao]
MVISNMYIKLRIIFNVMLHVRPLSLSFLQLMITTSPYSIHFSLIHTFMINLKGNFKSLVPWGFEGGHGETQLNVNLEEYIEIPTTPIPSPAQQDGPQRGKSTVMP